MMNKPSENKSIKKINLFIDRHFDRMMQAASLFVITYWSAGVVIWLISRVAITEIDGVNMTTLLIAAVPVWIGLVIFFEMHHRKKGNQRLPESKMKIRSARKYKDRIQSEKRKGTKTDSK